MSEVETAVLGRTVGVCPVCDGYRRKSQHPVRQVRDAARRELHEHLRTRHGDDEEDGDA